MVVVVDLEFLPPSVDLGSTGGCKGQSVLFIKCLYIIDGSNETFSINIGEVVIF